MLRSCAYCGRYHDTKKPCEQKIRAEAERLKKWQKKKGTAIDRFHSSARWTRLSLYIRERDNNMCLACLYGIGCQPHIEPANLSVHHIIPVSENWDGRFEEDNLVTLCRDHHEQAEEGEISRRKLLDLLKRHASGEIPPALSGPFLLP